jgi:hypothetical protein
MKYPKPAQLSDPHQDWTENPEVLAEIISKPDEALTVEDFYCIFQGSLPAGTYEESAYYIEKCFLYIVAQDEIKVDRCPGQFFWWLDINRQRLEVDCLWDQIVALTEATLWKLLERFELHDLTEQECDHNGIDFRYSIYPNNANTVQTMVEEMLTYESFPPILDPIIDALVLSDKVDHIHWFVQLAWHAGNLYPWEDDITDDLFNNPRSRARKIQFYEKLNHPALYEKKYSILVQQSPIKFPAKYQQTIS